jgi:hypothetical protein
MRLLLVVEPGRKDWYNYLKKYSSVTYILLWYEDKNDIPEWIKNDIFFSEIYYWNLFSTPCGLLKKIQPDKIIFFEIIDQRQISLLVTANSQGIKTFYLEHGAAGSKNTAILRSSESNYFRKTRLKYLLKRLQKSFYSVIKSKFFYYLFYYSGLYNNLSLSSFWKYVRLPVSMIFYSPIKVLSTCIFPERQPYKAIVFNKPNLEQFQFYTGITDSQACLTGVPIFDNYFSKSIQIGNHISYIDHPYLENDLFGWTAEWHEMVAHNLYDFVKRRNHKLLVKLHPYSDKKLWDRYNFNLKHIKIVQDGDYTSELLESGLILSYCSSMVTGFLSAKKNVVLLGWHPAAKIIGADFSQSGLCHVSLSPSEIDNLFDYWLANNLVVSNTEKYCSFLSEYNFPFDGKASERVMQIILNNEIS